METQSHKKLFIDLGGHLGQSIERFYWTVPYASSWDIVSFEPLTYIQLLNNTEKYGNVSVVPKAAWIENTELQFYVDEQTKGIGSTVLKGKLSGKIDYQHPVKIKAIDFAEWFQTKNYDYIVVKMNIEGAEYILLPYFIKEDLLSRIDELYVETHWNKFDLPDRVAFKQVEDVFIKKARKFKTKLYFYRDGILFFQCRINYKENENG